MATIFGVPPSSNRGTLVNLIEGARLSDSEWQPLSGNQQKIIRRHFLQIKTFATGFSGSEGTVVDEREFPLLKRLILNPHMATM
jgi:hypothetical protein